jgi:hypothetical protein
MSKKAFLVVAAIIVSFQSFSRQAIYESLQDKETEYVSGPMMPVEFRWAEGLNINLGLSQIIVSEQQ